ncbi:MAG: hypothetical protein Q9161_005860 [Pseudevernia consocians]
MAKAPTQTLVIIGTARKPNASDLRDRGLSGLPDPSPEVALRRADLQSEQAALRAEETIFHGEKSFSSSLRTEIGGQRDTNDDISDLDGETGSSILSEDSILVKIEDEDSKGDEGILQSIAHCDIPQLSESAVADDAPGGAQNAIRKLRHRKPIQLHPYALEREVYRQRVKVGRVE